MIERLKSEIKISISNDFEKSLDDLLSMLINSSNNYNTVLVLKARFKDLQNKRYRGEISLEEENLLMNKILSSTFSLIQELEETDFIRGIVSTDLDVKSDYDSLIIENVRRFLIIDNFPKLGNVFNRDDIITFLKNVCYLANFDFDIIENSGDIKSELKKKDVVGIITDKRVAVEYNSLASNLNKAVVGIEYDDKFYASIRGKRIDAGIDLLNKSKFEHQLAKELCNRYESDTPRGVGFHGNWFGTYGFMTLLQDHNYNVFGKYWYGSGELTGKCALDFSKKQLILNYHWSQRKNNTEIGSTNNGIGKFVLPLGKEYFLGSWKNASEEGKPHLWNGTRCSEDLSSDIKKHGTTLGSLKLSEDLLESIVDWK